MMAMRQSKQSNRSQALSVQRSSANAHRGAPKIARDPWEDID